MTGDWVVLAFRLRSLPGRRATRLGIAAVAIALLAGCQEGATIHVLNKCLGPVEIEGTGDPSGGVKFVPVEPHERHGLVTVKDDWTVLDFWVRDVGDLGGGQHHQVSIDSDRISPGADSDYLLTLDGDLCPGRDEAARQRFDRLIDT